MIRKFIKAIFFAVLSFEGPMASFTKYKIHIIK